MFFTRRYFRLAAVVRGVPEGPREHFDPVAFRPSPISSILLNCAGVMAAKSLRTCRRNR